MDTPKWTDIYQAWAGVGTAIFTALSVILVCAYTYITKRALTIAQGTYEESLRPVVILVKVEVVNGVRVATFKNTGGGLAVNLKLLLAGQTLSADNNVLAAKETLDYSLPLPNDQGILDLSYTGLTNKPLRTICFFLRNGRAFNDYIADAHSLDTKKIDAYYSAITKYALAVQAKLLNAQHP